MKPGKGRSVMGRCFYDCGCGQRFRSTVVEGEGTVRCPACRQPCGVADVSPPRERGGLTPHEINRRPRTPLAIVEEAAKLLLPDGENIRVVGLGSEGRASGSFDGPGQTAQPDQSAQNDPSPRDEPEKPTSVMPLSEAQLALLATPLTFDEQQRLDAFVSLNGLELANEFLRTQAMRPPYVAPPRDPALADASKKRAPVRELPADVPAPAPPRLIYISELSPLPQAVLVAAREVVTARRASSGHPTWALAVTLRSLETAVDAWMAAPRRE